MMAALTIISISVKLAGLRSLCCALGMLFSFIEYFLTCGSLKAAFEPHCLQHQSMKNIKKQFLKIASCLVGQTMGLPTLR